MPTRFLTMVSHLVLLLTVLLSRDDYVRACLPFDFEQEDFDRKDVELVSCVNVGALFMQPVTGHSVSGMILTG